MSADERRARLLTSVYAAFGASAAWIASEGADPLPCTIRPDGGDGGQEVASFGRGGVLVDVRLFRVRRTEIANPTAGAQVQVRNATGDLVETLKVVAQPRLAPLGLEWVVEATATTP